MDSRFLSPHYFYPTDNAWKFNGPLEADEVATGMFARKGVLNLDGLEGSGADWLERFRPYIPDGVTVVVAPHRSSGRRPTTSYCSCANGTSGRLFSGECWRICALKHTYANCWSKVLKLPS